MNYLKERFGKLKPRYLSSFEDLIKSYSQFGGGASEDKFNKAKSFSNTYEFYIYAFFLGLRKNKKLEIQDSDNSKSFWEIENWKPADLVSVLFCCAIAESNFDLVNAELIPEEDLRKELSVLLTVIESYANGGFFLIQQELESDDEQAADDLFFVKLLGA